MLTRRDLLCKAVDDCMKEIYRHVQPSVEWDEFINQNQEYLKKEKEWDGLDRDNRPKKKDYCGPAPYEFYYIPNWVMKEITDSYVSAYKIDNHKELVDIIDILKNYFDTPTVDKYVDDYTDEYGNHHPGYRSYDNPDNIMTEIRKILSQACTEESVDVISKQLYDKIFCFFDMAAKFFSWNAELNSFNCSVYLGCSPNSNKEAVIKNWKEYKGIDIDIDDEMYKTEEYGYFDEENDLEDN